MQVLGSSDLEATYAALSRTEFTWEELQQRPLPPGVDPARIEAYLSTDAFQVLFWVLCPVVDEELMIRVHNFLAGSNWSINLLWRISSNLFQEKFSMTKADYSASPRWKQIEMKKNAGLFWTQVKCEITLTSSLLLFWTAPHLCDDTAVWGTRCHYGTILHCKILVDNCLLKMMPYWCRWCRHVICSIGDGEHAE